MFMHLFGRLTNRTSSQATPRQRVALNLVSLEERVVPAQILLASGADASSTTFWAKEPPSLGIGTDSIYPNGIFNLLKDANGLPIDFNKDGSGDLVQFGFVQNIINYSQAWDSRGRQGPQTIAATRGPGIAALMNRGDKFETIPQPSGSLLDSNIVGGTRSCVVDLNGDGYQDLMNIVDDQPAIGVYKYLYNPATQAFGNSRIKIGNINVPETATAYGEAVLRDLNNDQLPDLILPFFTAPAKTNQGTIIPGIFSLTGFGAYLGKTGPGGTFEGVFEADPYFTVPLTATNPNYKGWDGKNGLTLESGFPTDQLAPNANPGIADFNNDGFLDMVLPEANGVTFVLNPGNGRFDTGARVFVPTATGRQAAYLVVGDFNNDGLADVASSPNIVSTDSFSDDIWNAVQAPLTLFINSGSTASALQFTATPLFVDPVMEYPGSIAVGDLNLDGNLDLVIGSGKPKDTQYSVAQGDGQGGFTFTAGVGYTNSALHYVPWWLTNIQLVPYERAITSISISDMNSDGMPDVVALGNHIHTITNVYAVPVTGISYNTTFTVPSATPPVLPTAALGIPYSQLLGHQGGDKSQSYEFFLNPNSVRLPAGLTLSPDGRISGTPTTAGAYQLLVDVVQTNGLRGESFVNLRVDNFTPGGLVITPGSLPGGTKGVPYNLQLGATGATGAVSFGISSGALPPGMALGTNGLISGSPTSTGFSSFTVGATDSSGTVGYRSYDITVVNPTAALAPPFIVAGSGQGGLVSIFNADGVLRRTISPYGTSYLGAVTVAQGDVNGDGVADLVTGTGAGVAPHVLVLDGNTLAVISSFYAYAEQFLGGVRVAAGDVDGNGKAEVVTGTGPGSAPNVCVFNGTTGATQQSFYAYAPEYLGGINVGAGDVTGDGKADIITGSGVGVSPHVVVFDSATAQAIYSFYAYLPQFKGGVNVGAGDVDSDGKADILTGAGPGGDPHVKVFSGADGTQKQSFDAFAVDFNGGVSVASADLNQDGKADIIAGTQTQSAQVKAFNATDLSVLDDFFAFQGAVGVWVAGK